MSSADSPPPAGATPAAGASSGLTAAAAQLRIRPAGRYGAALGLVALATVATAGVRPVIETYTVNVYIVAIALAAWYGGLGPGLLATALSAIALDYFFAPPYFSLFPITTSDAVRLALLVLAGLTISWVCHLLRRSVREIAAGSDRLAASEALFRHTFEQAAVGIAHVGPDGKWLRVNERLAEALGYGREELLARTFQEITHPDDLDVDVAHVQALLRGEAERYAMDKRYVRRDGSLVWVRLSVSLVRDAAGAPDYFIAVAEDIDARKRAEAEAGRLGAMLERITDAVVAFEGNDLRVRYLNAEAERLWRRPAAECLGRTVLELFPDTTELPFFRETQRAVLERRPVQYEEFYPAHETWYEVRVYPMAGAAGPGGLAIFQDVTARRAAAARAEEARALAEAGSRAKTSFLAAMSHELRTPINAIGGYADLLELGIAGPLTEQQRSYVERTRLAARALLAVINDVLDIAKIESGKASAARHVGWAASAAEAAVALVQPQALEKGVALVNACAGDVAYWGDEARVQQILTNLIGNAIKFTPPGGRVTVSCGAAEGGPGHAPDGAPNGEPATAGAQRWTVVRVQDTGVGIAPEALERVFGAFEQAETGYNRAHTGTGLGLTISRQLARLMGGDVTAHSVPGEGSSFFLHLAAASPAEARTDAPAAVERRGAARYTHGLGVVGEAALGEIERIVAACAARLRTDPRTPSAHALTDAQLDDHTASLLTDIAQTLVIIEAAQGGPSDMLRDGTAIQRLVAERHGALRARLGWAEAELRRELGILREEMERAVRRRVAELAAVDPTAPERTAPVDEALALLGRFAEHAERASLEGFRRAAPGGTATGAPAALVTAGSTDAQAGRGRFRGVPEAS